MLGAYGKQCTTDSAVVVAIDSESCYLHYQQACAYFQSGSQTQALNGFVDLQKRFTPQDKKDSAFVFLLAREIDVLNYALLDPNYNMTDIEAQARIWKPHLGRSEQNRLQFLLGKTHCLRYDYLSAEDYLDEALNAEGAYLWQFDEALYLYTKTSYKNFNYQKVVDCAVWINKVQKQGRWYTEVNNYLAYAYFMLHKYQAAIEQLNVLVDEYNEGKEYLRQKQNVSTVKATCYSRLGDAANAERFFREAEKVSVPKSEGDNLLYLYDEWANHFKRAGQKDKAFEVFTRCSGVLDVYEVSTQRKAFYYRRVLNEYSEYVDVARFISLVEVYLNELTSKGLKELDVQIVVSRLMREKTFRKSELWKKEEGGLSDLFIIYNEFKDVYNISIQVLNNTISTVDRRPSVWLRIDTENLFLTAYKLYQLTGDNSFVKDMHACVEQGKAMQFKNTISFKQEMLRSGISRELLEREKAYKVYVERIRYLLSDEAISSEDSLGVQELREKLPSAQYRYDSVKKVIDDKLGEMHTITYSTEEVQKQLNADVAVLNYFVSESRLFAFFTNHKQTVVKEVQLDTDIQVLATKYRNALEGYPNAELSANAVEEFKDLSKELYAYLIQPFDSLIVGKDLIVIPDRELALIPFETLISDKKGDAFGDLSYLVRTNAISEMYTLRQLFEPSEVLTRQSEYIGFAPDYSGYHNAVLGELKGAAHEVEQIGEYFKGLHYVGEQATSHKCYSEAGKYDIVHLALHTRVNDFRPMHSQLLFSNEEKPLTVFEVYGMHYKTKLLVLSACNTGSGQLRYGEGVMNLARGFFFAGVKSIIVTKWAVPDGSSASLMDAFYNALSEGLPSDRALQQAKLCYMQKADPLMQHPYYWAAYASTGNPVQKVKSKSALYAVVLLVFVLAYFLMRKRNSAK